MTSILAVKRSIGASRSAWFITTILYILMQITVSFLIHPKKRKEKFSNLAITIVIIDIFVWDSCTSVETREILVRIIKRSLCKDNALVTM